MTELVVLRIFLMGLIHPWMFVWGIYFFSREVPPAHVTFCFDEVSTFIWKETWKGNIMCVSTSPCFPLHLGWLYRLKLSWCHCTAPQVKGSAELSHSLEGHQKTPRCHLSCGWAGMGVHTLLSSPLVHWLHSADWKNVELFLTFSGKELSRGKQDQQILFTEIAAVSCSCRSQGRKGQMLFACLSHTPGKRQVPGPHLLVGILVHSLSTMRSS